MAINLKIVEERLVLYAPVVDLDVNAGPLAPGRAAVKELVDGKVGVRVVVGAVALPCGEQDAFAGTLDL